MNFFKWFLISRAIWTSPLKSINFLKNTVVGNLNQTLSLNLIVELATENLNYLTINNKKQLKVGGFKNLFKKTIGISIGVVLRILNVDGKCSKKMEKNQILFLNYLIKHLIDFSFIRFFKIKYFNLNFLLFLKKINIFWKLIIFKIFVVTVTKLTYFSKIARIKRRLKKRLLRYELTSNN